MSNLGKKRLEAALAIAGYAAAINILNLALQATGGHPGRNAVGVGVTTLVGASLLEQTLTLSTESPQL